MGQYIYIYIYREREREREREIFEKINWLMSDFLIFSFIIIIY